MPLRLLRRVLERHQLGSDAVEHSPVAQQREADRGPAGLEQELLDLAEDALGGQLAERHRGAEPRGIGVDGELEAGRELDGTQRAQRILAERPRVHRAQGPCLEIRPAATGIHDLPADRLEGHRVDREIAPPRRLLDGEARITGDRDAAMAGADLRVAARDRDVDRSRHVGKAAELEHGEGLADRVHRAEAGQDLVQPRGVQTEHLDVVVLHRQAEERIPYRAAHDVRPPTGAAQGVDEEVHTAGQRDAWTRHSTARIITSRQRSEASSSRRASGSVISWNAASSASASFG
jgi:hypothetical protein